MICFFFCLDKKYTVQVYIGQNVQVTCASVRMRPHKHTNKQDGTQLQVNIHQKDCAKTFSHPKTEKKSKMRRWKMTTPTKERPCCDWGRKQVKLSLVIN